MSDRENALSKVLDSDEAVIWSGQPQGTQTRIWQSADFAAGWVFAIGLTAAAIAKGFAFLSGDGQDCHSARHCGSDYIFGSVFLIAAALILYAACRVSMSAVRQRRSVKSESYAITDRRALLFRTVGGRMTVRSVPVHPDLWMAYVPGSGGEIGLSRMVHSESDDGSSAYDEEMVVFRDLADPDTPYGLLRRIQHRQV